MPLEQGSFAYPYWKKSPVPVFMQFYVFDVVNVDEVVETGAKPCVVERGPYTYRYTPIYRYLLVLLVCIH